VKVFWDEEKYGRIIHIFYKKEANSALFAEFLSKMWAILTIFMSSMSTFIASYLNVGYEWIKRRKISIKV